MFQVDNVATAASLGSTEMWSRMWFDHVMNYSRNKKNPIERRTVGLRPV